MNPEEIIGMLRKYLSDTEGLNVFGGRIGVMQNAVGLMVNQAKKSAEMKSGAVQAEPKDIELVNVAMNLLRDILLEMPITKGLADFSMCLSIFTRSWVQNCAPNEINIRNSAVFIERFVQGVFTIKELIDVSKFVARRLRQLEQVGFPSVKHARHFLETLEDEMKQKQPEVKDAIRMGGSSDCGCHKD